MLKYKVLVQEPTGFTWQVMISGKIKPTVGDFIREIKEAPIQSSSGIMPSKHIYVYKKGIRVATCIFTGEIVDTWMGTPSEVWAAPVARCEMSYSGINPTFRIWIKEPRHGAYVYNHPILPWLKDAISMPIPTGV